MKDYYQILGVKKMASRAEIEAHWAELMKQYRSDLKERGETDEKIKEINEAYEVLKNPSTRMKYDFERFLKRSDVKKISQRREKRFGRKKIIVPAGIVVLFLVVGFFVFKMAQLTTQQKPIIAPSAPVPEAKRPTSVSKSILSEIPKAPDQKSSPTIPEQIAKSQETILPVAKLPEKELEPKEKIAKETFKTEKIIPKDMPKTEVPKSPKPISKEIPKVEEPKPVSTEPRPATAYVPVPEGAQKPEVAVVTEKETPKVTPKEIPREVPKEVVKEAPKEALKEVSPVLPKEEVKTIPQEPPVSQPSQPKEAKPMDQKSQVAPIPPAKPVAPIAAIPPMPHPFVTEQEVRQFLAKYVDRYTQKDIEGFLSFFSPMAIQNQKDGIEGIRKIYSRQFELYERLKYRLKDPKIEILEKSVKVRASYEIEQFSKKGETKQLRGDIEWDLVKEEGELKILTIRYRHDKTR